MEGQGTVILVFLKYDLKYLEADFIIFLVFMIILFLVVLSNIFILFKLLFSNKTFLKIVNSRYSIFFYTTVDIVKCSSHSSILCF